jgi:hypothetical protein
VSQRITLTRIDSEEFFMKHRMGILRRAWFLAIVLLSILWLPACGSDSGRSTSPTTVVTLVTDTLSGSIGQNGSSVHTFTVTNSGYTLLAGFTGLSPSTVTALGLGVGSWDSSTSTCGLNLSQNDTARSGNTGISGTPNSGSYCLRIYDGGNIPAGVTASYTVQVQHY